MTAEPQRGRIKPQRRARPLARRADAALPLLTAAAPGRELLLDTCVYIDILQARAPAGVEAPLNDALLFLQAIKLGCDLLSANIADFDLFDQLLPGSGVTLCRRA